MIEGILDKILQIPVSTYDFKKEFCEDDEKRTDKLGLISEDFFSIFDRGSDKKINGQDVQMALWLAVQELKAENNLKDEIIGELIERIVVLENK